MIVDLAAVDPARVAELAYAEVLAARPRTPARRAAAALYYAAVVPPAKSVGAIKNALDFAPDTVQVDALELLHRLTAQLATTEQEQATMTEPAEAR